MAPSLFMIEVRKAAGDTLEYHKVSFSYHFLPSVKLSVHKDVLLRFLVNQVILVDHNSVGCL